MAAVFFVLLDRKKPTKEREYEILNALAGVLNNGYTYQIIHNEIVSACQQDRIFNFGRFQNKITDNLIKQGVRYYHKELTIRNTLTPVIHDVDAGIITNSKNVFWIEPRASYTLDDIVSYFYSKKMADQKQYYPKRVRGILSSFIDKYSLEITLFMLERAATIYYEEKRQFNLKTFDDYFPMALQFIEEVKNNCTYSGGANYVCRKRMLFD